MIQCDAEYRIIVNGHLIYSMYCTREPNHEGPHKNVTNWKGAIEKVEIDGYFPEKDDQFGG